MSQVFIDTSIQIARFVHSPESKRRIEDRLEQYEAVLSGLVVRHEFKRRLLKEAQYLLGLIKKYGSFERVNRHVIDVLPVQQARKRNICLEMIATVFEAEGDADRTDRLKLFLRSLIMDGLDDFRSSISHLREDADCACAKIPIRELKAFEKYEFGTDKCSQTNNCGIKSFLHSHVHLLTKILEEIRSIQSGKKSSELSKAEAFIEAFLTDADRAQNSDPCLTVGDLLIALESVGVSTFYTMNAKESQHLCRVLEQHLIVRPKHPERDDLVCNAEATWPEF